MEAQLVSRKEQISTLLAVDGSMHGRRIDDAPKQDQEEGCEDSHNQKSDDRLPASAGIRARELAAETTGEV